jgi:hypothetical protein
MGVDVFEGVRALAVWLRPTMSNSARRLAAQLKRLVVIRICTNLLF